MKLLITIWIYYLLKPVSVLCYEIIIIFITHYNKLQSEKVYTTLVGIYNTYMHNVYVLY